MLAAPLPQGVKEYQTVLLTPTPPTSHDSCGSPMVALARVVSYTKGWKEFDAITAGVAQLSLGSAGGVKVKLKVRHPPLGLAKSATLMRYVVPPVMGRLVSCELSPVPESSSQATSVAAAH